MHYFFILQSPFSLSDEEFSPRDTQAPSHGSSSEVSITYSTTEQEHDGHVEACPQFANSVATKQLPTSVQQAIGTQRIRMNSAPTTTEVNKPLPMMMDSLGRMERTQIEPLETTEVQLLDLSQRVIV